MRDGWRNATLGDVSEIVIGRTPPRNEARFWTAELDRPFCTIADMSGQQIVPRREGVTEAAEIEGKARRVPAGALLMSFKLSLGRVGFAAVDLFPNEAIAWLNTNCGDVDDRYLAVALSSMDLAEFAGQAVKGKTLNERSLKAIPFVLPPLEEQRRIVDLVAAVDEAIEATNQNRQRTCDYLQSLFDDHASRLTGEVALESLGETVTGRTPPTAVPSFWSPPDIPFFTPGDFVGDLELRTAVRHISEAGAEQARRLPPFSVAQTCIGSIGKVAVLTHGGSANQQINALLGLDCVDAIALAAVLRSHRMQSVVRSLAGHTVVPILKKSRWQTMTLPWGSRSERAKFVELVSDAEEVRSAAEALVLTLETLRGAVLADFLSGHHEIPASYDELSSA
ncbi:MAG TPA: restriction endonuclease subunit S [Acidimicrobiales bacterium]|nr:restriction endonuclease subunit S [Acidimicrobiales bacterium]